MSLLLALALLTSCEDFFMQEITDFDSGFTPQLSLFALLQPKDTLVIVDVRRTIASIGGDDSDENFRRSIPDARVTISDGTTTIPLTHNRSPNGYFANSDTLPDNFIHPGGSYRIEATHEALTASAMVAIPTDSIEREDINFVIGQETSGGFTEVTVTADIANLPGQEEYYVLITERSSAPDFRRRQRVLSDFLQGRANLGDRLAFKPVSLFEFNKTVIQICATDAATYNFLNLRNTAVTNADNPFAEPVILPSNVENGVGHVGGLNCQFFTFRR